MANFAFIHILHRPNVSHVVLGPLSPSLSTPPLPPLELTPQERTELGYMPLRDDFERVSIPNKRETENCFPCRHCCKFEFS